MNDIAYRLRQRTLRYTIRIISYCKVMPDDWVAREIGKQLLRAGMGVSGNYWSACRGRSDKEFIAKLGVASDEAEDYRSPSIISSSASLPGRTRSSGSVASGWSTTFSCARKSSRSGSM